MHRTQISLEPDQYRRLKQAARGRGISLSALLRELIDARIGGAPLHGRKESDPLAGITGIAEGTGEPVGRQHDEFLYGGKRRAKSR